MWAIQHNLLKPLYVEQIANTLDELSASYVSLLLIPFSEEIVFLKEILDTKELIPFGATKLVRLAKQNNWRGCFFDNNTFNVEAWNKHRDDMLNNDAILTTVGEASLSFKQQDPTSNWFIRPLEDLKAFNGVITTAEQICKWKESPDAGNFSFPDSTRIAISNPKIILSEARYFIVGGKVIDGSIYKINNQRQQIHEEDIVKLEQVQKLADKWLPHETCVMDLAETPEGLKIIEFNCFNCSGFYAHNIPKIIKAVNEYFNKN